MTPISGFSSRFQGRNRGLPRSSVIALGAHQDFGALAFGDDVPARSFRQTEAISRSRFRTPASRV